MGFSVVCYRWSPLRKSLRFLRLMRILNHTCRMCYSSKISIMTFIFVSIICIVLWYCNKGTDRPIALILFVVVLMQLVEYGIWENLDCNYINKFLSSFIPILLFLQPILINLIVWWFSAGWAPGYLPITLAFSLFLPYKIYTAWLNYGNCVKVSEGSHLEWVSFPDQSTFGIIERYIYYVALAYPIATLNNIPFAILFIMFSFLSLIKTGQTNQKTWPSIWCHFVNFLSVFALIRQI